MARAILRARRGDAVADRNAPRKPRVRRTARKIRTNEISDKQSGKLVAPNNSKLNNQTSNKRTNSALNNSDNVRPARPHRRLSRESQIRVGDRTASVARTRTSSKLSNAQNNSASVKPNG